MNIRGIIFDMDDTLIESPLDFDAIRADLGFGEGQLILETIESLDDDVRQTECRRILREHERRAAQQCKVISGVEEFLAELNRRGMLTAVLTRNSRETVELVFSRLQLAGFDQILTREDAPPKPDPAGLKLICERWNIDASEVLFFGDFWFDIEAARRAGAHSVLYAPNNLPEYAHKAGSILRDYADAIDLLDSILAS